MSNNESLLFSSFERNKHYPPLNLESCSFFVFCLTDESHAAFEYNLLRQNEHYDESLIPQELKNLADPNILLDSTEKGNWKPKIKRKQFSKKEIEFRKRYVTYSRP